MSPQRRRCAKPDKQATRRPRTTGKRRFCAGEPGPAWLPLARAKCIYLAPGARRSRETGKPVGPEPRTCAAFSPFGKGGTRAWGSDVVSVVGRRRRPGPSAREGKGGVAVAVVLARAMFGRVPPVHGHVDNKASWLLDQTRRSRVMIRISLTLSLFSFPCEMETKAISSTFTLHVDIYRVHDVQITSIRVHKESNQSKK